MKFKMIRPSVLAISASALIFAASACNPNRNNPNYNASRTQPGTVSSPGMSGSSGSGNTGSLSGAGDTSNTGSNSPSGSATGNP